MTPGSRTRLSLADSPCTFFLALSPYASTRTLDALCRSERGSGMVQNIDLPQGPLLLLRILTLHGGRSRSERSRFRTTCCKFDKAQLTRRCTDWTAAAGSRPAGALREITAAQNSTNLPKPDANSSNGRKMLGTN